MKNVLVIGGSYFVGKTFVEHLRDRSEYSLCVMNRGTRPLKLDGVTEIVCDRHDAGLMTRVIPPLEWHAVIDFCAYQPGDISTVIQNIRGSIQQYIYISTASVLQDSVNLPMNEDSPKLTAPLTVPGGDYAYNKLILENELEDICRNKKIPHVTLRPSFVYGKYNYAPRESYFFDLISRNETIILPSRPQSLFSMVSVWDAADIIIACIGNDRTFNSSYNVCSEELVSYDKLITVLEAISAKKLQTRRHPAHIISASNLPLPFPLEEHLVYSGSRLQNILNYHYMSLMEGMTKTYNWFFKIGN